LIGSDRPTSNEIKNCCCAPPPNNFGASADKLITMIVEESTPAHWSNYYNQQLEDWDLARQSRRLMFYQRWLFVVVTEASAHQFKIATTPIIDYVSSWNVEFCLCGV
jgi:hypothetical protein